MLTTIRAYFRDTLNDFKARRRGEVRVAPRGTRGRVYAPKDAPSPPVFLTKKQPTATLTMTVTRGDGTVEKIVVPATVTFPNG